MNLYTLPGTRLRRGIWMDFLVMRALFPLWMRLADHIVTISHSTQSDLARLFPRAARKASVIYPPFDPSRLRAPADPPPRRMGSRPYFLYVGVMAPSKNIERLVRAFRRFRGETSADTALVLAGRECGAHMAGTLQPLIRSLGLTRDVVWTGFVDDAERSVLYRDATAVAFPSMSEGFGYPIVEGMAAGVPVITSNVSSCAEVAGDAALLVDPYSEDAIAGALRRIVEDGPLRERLVAAGRRRCAAFAPQAVARQYLALAERLDAEGRPRNDR
jgi:glycosyltransferase involved in cell wall biosynthesis